MQLFLFPRSWPTRKPRNWIGNPAWVVAYDILDVVLVVGIETTMWIRLLVAMEDEGPQIFIYSLHTPSIGKTWTIHRQWTIIAIFIGYLLSSFLGGQLRLCCGRRHVMTPSPRRAAQNEDDGQIVTIVASISRDIVLLGRHIIAPGKLDGTRNQMSWIIPLIGVKARDVWWIFKWLMWMLKGEINYRVFAGYTSQLSLISIPELGEGWQAPSTCQLLLVRWAAC